MSSPTLVSACGLVCSECEALKATHANDAEAIEKIAERWRIQHNPNIQAAHVWCDGCMTASPRKCAHTADCEIRACVMAKGLDNCATCDDYACTTLGGFLQMVPQARKVLEEIRARR
jgi:hypothetical protein